MHSIISIVGICTLTLYLTACGEAPPDSKTIVYQAVATSEQETLLAKYAPYFLIDQSQEPYNRIGTPELHAMPNGTVTASVNPEKPMMYGQAVPFTTDKGHYINLIYRVHFPEIPLSIASPTIAIGNNVGLIAIVTLNLDHKPVLLTTVHTCGCYIAVMPTDQLPLDALPDGWDTQQPQNLYGIKLPSLIRAPEDGRFAISVANVTHRVRDVCALEANSLPFKPTVVYTPLVALEDLRRLPLGGTYASFFYEEGTDKGYVRNSFKPLEFALMGWWTLDRHIGMDKDYGPAAETGTIFYVSLNPWQREDADLWHFALCLSQWGWKL